MSKQLAYSVIYTATRSGATKSHITFYRTNEQISTAEQFVQMLNDISRQAVANGQANNVEDVTVNSVSLLNPMDAIELPDFTQERDTASKTDAEQAFVAFHGAIEDILQSYDHRPEEAMDMLEQVKQEMMIRAQLASELNDVIEGREYAPKKCNTTEEHVNRLEAANLSLLERVEKLEKAFFKTYQASFVSPSVEARNYAKDKFSDLYDQVDASRNPEPR